MDKFKEYLSNQSMDMRSVGFNAILPTPTVIPASPYDPARLIDGARVLEDGSVRLCFYGPGAAKVTAKAQDRVIEFTKDDEGLWHGLFGGLQPGFVPLFLEVDGCPVLSPIMPIAYGSNRVINYVEIPDLDQPFLLLRDVPHGAVTREFYYSTVTQEWESCLVYTPAGYSRDLDKKYPVVYLQHGGGENENCWIYQGKINFTLDNMVADGEAPEMIVVMNNGMVQLPREDGSRYSDCWVLGDVLDKDCIPFIESRYRVLGDREHRAYAGLSMGSLVGAKITMEHPELFSAAGLFTGIFSPMGDTLSQSYMKALDDAEAFNAAYPIFFRCMGLQEVSIPLFAEESAYLDSKGIRYIEGKYPGAHEWRTWRRCFYEFAKLIFRDLM